MTRSSNPNFALHASVADVPTPCGSTACGRAASRPARLPLCATTRPEVSFEDAPDVPLLLGAAIAVSPGCSDPHSGSGNASLDAGDASGSDAGPAVISLAVLGRHRTDLVTSSKVTESGAFVNAHVSVTNNGSTEPAYTNPGQFTLVTAGGKVVRSDILATTELKSRGCSPDVGAATGATLTCDVVFHTSGDAPAKLMYMMPTTPPTNYEASFPDESFPDCAILEVRDRKGSYGDLECSHYGPSGSFGGGAACKDALDAIGACPAEGCTPSALVSPTACTVLTGACATCLQQAAALQRCIVQVPSCRGWCGIK